MRVIDFAFRAGRYQNGSENDFDGERGCEMEICAALSGVDDLRQKHGGWRLGGKFTAEGPNHF